MRLGEKLQALRLVEGTLRGLGREMTQSEVSRLIRSELSESISQAYLSQIESGRRRHLTNTSRLLLSRFFKVHPGFLVDDPEGFHTELTSHVRGQEDRLDLWLFQGAERFRDDAELGQALQVIARHADSRECLMLLANILETPDLAGRLISVFRREPPEAVSRRSGSPKPSRRSS